MLVSMPITTEMAVWLQREFHCRFCNTVNFNRSLWYLAATFVQKYNNSGYNHTRFEVLSTLKFCQLNDINK